MEWCVSLRRFSFRKLMVGLLPPSVPGGSSGLLSNLHFEEAEHDVPHTRIPVGKEIVKG